MAKVHAHLWPGNVRELEHAVQRAVVLARGPEISPGDLGLDESPGWRRRAVPATAEATSERERDRIFAMLDRYRGNRRAAARALGIDRSTLWRKLRRHATRNKREVCPSSGDQSS